MSDQSMAGNTDGQGMGGKTDPDMGGNTDDKGMDKPSQADGEMDDDGMSESDSPTSTS
jgi:hypothetical protein